jgi:hypothetical protein
VRRSYLQLFLSVSQDTIAARKRARVLDSRRCGKAGNKTKSFANEPDVVRSSFLPCSMVGSRKRRGRAACNKALKPILDMTETAAAARSVVGTRLEGSLYVERSFRCRG